MNSIIANEHNKKKCQKFTPQNVVKDMLDLAGYTHGLLGKTVLEYSFGSGNIIKQIVKRYIEDAWVSVCIEADSDIEYYLSEDVLHVIFDNLILNSIQQNEKINHLHITIQVVLEDGLLKFSYSDDGIGLDKKYQSNPMKILEVHETTRKDGHGLGMWIVNNTVNMSGGKIRDIQGAEGFSVEFSIGGAL